MNLRSHLLKALLVTGCLGVASSVFAHGYSENSGYGGWSLSGNLDHLNILPEVANRYDVQVGESATAIGVAGEYFSAEGQMTFSAGLNYILYNDNNEFRQYVDDYWDGRSYASSHANALMVFVEAGPKIRFGRDAANFFTVRGGASGIFDSTRAIANCSDCYSEDIDINGGVYGLVGIGHSIHALELSVQFLQYFTGDIDNCLRVKLSSSF